MGPGPGPDSVRHALVQGARILQIWVDFLKFQSCFCVIFSYISIVKVYLFHQLSVCVTYWHYFLWLEGGRSALSYALLPICTCLSCGCEFSCSKKYPVLPESGSSPSSLCFPPQCTIVCSFILKGGTLLFCVSQGTFWIQFTTSF